MQTWMRHLWLKNIYFSVYVYDLFFSLSLKCLWLKKVLNNNWNLYDLLQIETNEIKQPSALKESDIDQINLQ